MSKIALKYDLFQVLDISTGHITKKDNELLQAYCDVGGSHIIGLIVYSYEYGYFINIPSKDSLHLSVVGRDLVKAGYSQDFVALMRLGRDLDCRFIRLDQDGDYYDDLPKHDW